MPMTISDHRDQLLFDQSTPGSLGYSVPSSDVPPAAVDEVPSGLLRDDIPGFPELTEVGLVRHFTRLSTWNYGVDTGMYPLGSCTMKYNPKVNETAARLPGFANLHPLTPDAAAQGALALMHALAQMLGEITGLAGTLPAPTCWCRIRRTARTRRRPPWPASAR